MSYNISEFSELINSFYKAMQGTRESISSIKLSEDKWTLKEMVGHLIDSASNNHQRFVRLQLAEKLDFPAYEAENWKNIERVNGLDWKVLIDLWKSYNELLLHIIEAADKNSMSHYWIKNGEKLTLEFLINDYYRHIKWHMDLFSERAKEIGQSASK